MSTVSSDDFGSLIAFASQLMFVLHDCLNPIGGAPKSQRQVIVYAHERTFWRSMTQCGSIMDSHPEVAFNHKAHRHCDCTARTPLMLLGICMVLWRLGAEAFLVSYGFVTAFLWLYKLGPLYVINRTYFEYFFYMSYEPPRDKTNNVAMRPAKTQIRLGIRPVWSESSLCAQWVAKGPSFLHADAQADLSLRWAHTHFVGFVTRRLICYRLLKVLYAKIKIIICHRQKNKRTYVS